MIYTVFFLTGIILFFIGNVYANLAGIGVVALTLIVMSARLFLKENTGDIESGLTKFCASFSCVIKDAFNPEIVKSRPGIDSVINARYKERDIQISVIKFRGSARSGGGRVGVNISASLTVNKELDIRVGRKSLIRLGDKFAGKDCVFYGAEETKVKDKKLLIAGKDKDFFIDLLMRDEALSNAVCGLIFDAGYGEFRIGTGGDKIFKTGKNYEKKDTNPDRLKKVIDFVSVIMEKTDNSEALSRTKPAPPPVLEKKGFGAAFVIALVIVIVLFIFVMTRIP